MISELQRKFDKFMIEMACGKNAKCSHFKLWFAERMGVDVWEKLKGSGLERVPPDAFDFVPVRAWLFQAYPQFMDAYHMCMKKDKPPSNIRLEMLKFSPPAKPHGAQVNAPRMGHGHFKKRVQAMAVYCAATFDGAKAGATPTRVKGR